ncbi:Laccase [Handroanthus impetiginosus]|uniref:Laccase n=1 Tax=Handroanthus impetiginosus TaxID=429701 RepID=A0A2G9H7U4_9LAMI|nr:Laccase [Handroanthus impetiginosus]
MREYSLLSVLALVLVLNGVNGDNPYRYYTWKITYGDIYPLGVKQQGILINGQFPGPTIDCVTNDNLIISVYNYLNEPFLISWNGLQQRRNSWQDGVFGTSCPIRPGKNFTYALQAKDQIGTYFYFPSLGLQKAAGGYGSIKIYSRPRIPVPFPPPAGDHVVLAGDWFKRSHRQLKYFLDGGHNLPFPDGLIINGRGWNGYTFTVEQGKTYRFRISNVGLTTSFNFRIQGHTMKLIEVEGSHTVQNTYSALDVHLGQSYSVLVTADQPAKDYYIVVSSRFTSKVLTSTAILNYRNSFTKVSGYPPGGPTTEINWSLAQARSIRPNWGNGYLATSVMHGDYRSFVEIVFQNWEDTVQSWHIDGYSFFVMGMEGGQWTEASRSHYNLRDTVARCTVQVYPRSWTAIYVALDNVGMWNIRSENWARQYLGQQFYLRVYTSSTSWREELPIPRNALLCGRARGHRTRPL